MPDRSRRGPFAAYYRMHHLVREGMKFLAVGGLGYVVDVGLFNVLRYVGGEGPLYDRPISAKVVSTVVATLVTYAGNRFWTFRHRRRTGYAREYALFFVLNAVGLAISVGCLALSHYVLDLRSPLADNISANIVGLGLAALFRFWSYRRWVFPELHLVEEVAPEPSADGEPVTPPASEQAAPPRTLPRPRAGRR